MTEVLNQKGASGLIAEYQCAAELQARLARSGFRLKSDLSWLERSLQETIPRVGGELSEDLRRHARRQGVALAEYIYNCITTDPQRLGLVLSASDIRRGALTVATVGRATNSGSSADLHIQIDIEGAQVRLPISLKAYRGSVSSLGSKGAKASLGRVFLADPRPSDADFVDAFGDDARRFVDLLADFKAASSEFYKSDSGHEFVEAYRVRKGDPLAKVNNPLRRKEVGDFFAATRGFKPEHRFAELYANIFRMAMARLRADGSAEEWITFLAQTRFLIGMDQDIVTLTASGFGARSITVGNSLDDGVYADIRKVLVRDCEVELKARPGSSVLPVVMSYAGVSVRCLSLTIWKDATIQYKIDSGVRR